MEGGHQSLLYTLIYYLNQQNLVVGRVGVETGMEVVGNMGIFQQGAYLKVHTLGGLENFLREGNFLGDLNILVRYRVSVGGFRGW